MDANKRECRMVVLVRRFYTVCGFKVFHAFLPCKMTPDVTPVRYTPLHINKEDVCNGFWMR
jgi:hypothetical protein